MFVVPNNFYSLNQADWMLVIWLWTMTRKTSFKVSPYIWCPPVDLDPVNCL